MFLLRAREKCPLFKCWLCWPVKKHWNDFYPPSLIMKPANGRNVCFICDCVVFRSVSVHNVDISTMFLQWSLIGWFCSCCLCISTHVVKWLCTLLNEAVVHIFEIKIYFSFFSNQAQCLYLLVFYACLLTYYCLLMFPFINTSVFIIGDVWEAYKKMAISHYCVVSILVLVHEQSPNQTSRVQPTTSHGCLSCGMVLLSLGLKRAGNRGSARRNAKIPVPWGVWHACWHIDTLLSPQCGNAFI